MFCSELSDCLENEADTINRIWSLNVTHFHLHDYVNRQNYHYWALQNPGVVTDNLLFPQQSTAQCALSSIGIFKCMLIEHTVSS
jgi:hypothetical protein